jgi:hypothetical protein
VDWTGKASGQTFVFPSKCCVCLGPAETKMKVTHQHRIDVTTTLTHTLQVPACRTCAQRQSSRLLFRLGLVAAIATLGWFLFRAMFPGEEGAAPAGAFIGLLLGGVVVGILRVLHPDPLRTDMNGNPLFLNLEYARLFKELNESEAAQSRRAETAYLWSAAMHAEKGRGSPDPSHALLYAALKGLSYQVQEELTRGADPSTKADGGYTPLMLAASKGHRAAVRALIAGGADVNARTLLGSTSQMLAEWEGHSGVAAELKAAEEGAAHTGTRP